MVYDYVYWHGKMAMIYRYSIKKTKLVANTKPDFLKGAFDFAYLAGERPFCRRKGRMGQGQLGGGLLPERTESPFLSGMARDFLN